jgi:ketosteroid isomerase-like protein
MQEKLLKLENDFGRAVTNDDVDALDGFLADDWIIVDPDGDIWVSMIA